MRYDKNISLIKLGNQDYNYNTGDFVEKETVIENRIANVSGVSLENEKLLFGSIGSRIKVFRIKGTIDYKFDCIKYDGESYNPVTIKSFSDDTIIYGSID